MKIDRMMGVVTVKNIAEASAWYERLFGRPADREPMPSLREWHGVDGGIQVLEMPDRAGKSFYTLLVGDLEAVRADLATRGLTLGPTKAGDAKGIAQIDDPSGNTITFAGRPTS